MSRLNTILIISAILFGILLVSWAAIETMGKSSSKNTVPLSVSDDDSSLDTPIVEIPPATPIVEISPATPIVVAAPVTPTVETPPVTPTVVAAPEINYKEKYAVPININYPYFSYGAQSNAVPSCGGIARQGKTCKEATRAAAERTCYENKATCRGFVEDKEGDRAFYLTMANTPMEADNYNIITNTPYIGWRDQEGVAAGYAQFPNNFPCYNSQSKFTTNRSCASYPNFSDALTACNTHFGAGNCKVIIKRKDISGGHDHIIPYDQTLSNTSRYVYHWLK